jgi:hypothetical protein
MKESLKERSFAEHEEPLTMLSELMNEIPPGMISWVFADWGQRLRLCLLMEGRQVE